MFLIDMILFIVCTSFENELLKDLINSPFDCFFFLQYKKMALSADAKVPVSPDAAELYVFYLLSEVHIPHPKSLKGSAHRFHTPHFIIIDGL